jgi:hypothetical protein
MSTESGRNEVYVRPFPGVDNGKPRVSTSGGDSPLWLRDGRELYCRSRDAVMAVPVKTEPTFRLETSKTLFRGAHVSSSFGNFADLNSWDISPDGKRFLMMKEAEPGAAIGEGPRPINIVSNWF